MQCPLHSHTGRLASEQVLKGDWEEQAIQAETRGGDGMGGWRDSRQREGWGGPRKVPLAGAQGPSGMVTGRLRVDRGQVTETAFYFTPQSRGFCSADYEGVW